VVCLGVKTYESLQTTGTQRRRDGLRSRDDIDDTRTHVKFKKTKKDPRLG
jgi:hypothetical protein